MGKSEYADLSFILRSSLSQRILQCLEGSGEPISPTQMAKKTRIDKSNVSTKLRMLQERKLVECINPGDRKWRFYKITDHGKKVLKKSEKAKEA